MSPPGQTGEEAAGAPRDAAPLTASARREQGGFHAHVRVGACDIAVLAAHIVHAVDLPAAGATPLPRRVSPRHGALAGVIELEGRAVPVVALERWLPLGEAAEGATARIVVLRSAQATIAIRVDALCGIQRIAASAIRTVCHDGADDELFQSVVPASAGRPMLWLLDVARLMALAAVWCDEADLDSAAPDPAAANGAVALPPSAPPVRHVVFAIGDKLWTMPARAVARLARTPPAELRLAGRRVCGIGSWEGRKLPFVDLGFAQEGGAAARPWMAVVVDGAQAMGVVVDRCERLVTLAPDAIFPLAGDELRAGTVMLPGLGEASVLAIDRLFAAVPEASISRLAAAAPAKTAPPADVAAPAGRETPAGAVPGADDPDRAGYLVFEADRPYASPAAGLIGVATLSDAAIDDLSQGRRATVDWRGETLGVVNMPRLDGGKAAFPAKVAVVVKVAGDGNRRSAIAIRQLTRWLPARSAPRSSMRLHSVGDVSVVTPTGWQRSSSIVVVDLSQMAYLLD